MTRMLLAATAALLCLPAGARADEVGEIVVTATKRDGVRAQDLPIALNVFATDDLRVRNVEDLTSLSYAMANVQIEDIGTARGIANVSIRGVGVNSSIASVDPAVGIFVDGVYQGMNAGSLTDLFDLEAIEVLRGPQGALHGRNVTGGAVLVRTRAPSDTFQAHARLGVETGPNTITEFVVSGPLAQGLLTGRLSLYHADDRGWLRNEFDGSRLGANETRIYRTSLRLTPAPDQEFILRAEQGRLDGDGPAGQNHALFARGSFDFAIDNRGYAATEWEQASLEANATVGFGNGRITSITAWRSVTAPWAADIDSTPNFVFHTRVLNQHEQLSQELRYAGAFGAFDLTTGVYYLEQDLLYVDERNFSPSFRRVGGGRGRFETWALFANIDWQVHDALTLNTGLRYTRENKHSRISRVRRALDDLDGPGVIVPGEGVIGGDIDGVWLNFSDAPFRQSWDDLSPRFGLQWRPNAHTNLYASWSRAHRSGGVNFRTSSLGLAPRAYEPEEQSTFEIGLKQDLFFGHGRLDVALFHNTISDMQRETNLADPISGVQQVVLNAGDATLHGGEIEASLRLDPFFSVSVQAGYVEGFYDRVSEDLNGDLVVDASDRNQRIPRLAPWTYGIALDYQRPVFEGEATARLSYYHRDAAFYNDTNFGRLPEIDMIDVHLNYTPDRGRWGVSFYGENLLNESTWGGDTTLPSTAAFGYSGGERPTFSPLNKGRVLGIEVRWVG